MKKDLKAIVTRADKQVGEGVVYIPSLDRVIKDVDVIPTGLESLDKALGVGGWPRGRIVEISGEEASAKSTLALHAIAEAQKLGLSCAYIDTEHAIDRVRAEGMGVSFEKILFSQPNSAEEALDLLEFLVYEKIDLIVLDSIAALVPQAELEGQMSDSTIGLMARLMGKALRKITATTSKNNVCVMFINQLRDKIGGFTPFPQKVGAGGNALKFYASVRVEMKKTGTSKTKDFFTKHKITVRKNKLAVPMRIVEANCGEKGLYESN